MWTCMFSLRLMLFCDAHDSDLPRPTLRRALIHFRRIGLVLSCGISVTTGYVRDSAIAVELVQEMMDDKHIELSGASPMGCVLSLWVS